MDAASNRISEAVDPDASIIFGVAFDESLEDEIKVTVIATGFDTDFKDKIEKKTISDITGVDLKQEPEKEPVPQKAEEDIFSSAEEDFDKIMAIFKNRK